VAVAFNAGNLGAVAKAMRDKFPDLPLILCADDDCRTEGNPGMTKSTEAARSVGALLAVPDFGANRPEGATDFNDMAATVGMGAVRQLICNLADSVGSHSFSEVSGVSGVQPSNDGPFTDTPNQSDGVSGVADSGASAIPDASDRPTFRVLDAWQEHGGQKFKPGLWHFGADKDGNPVNVWVCSPLHVEAVTHDGQANNFGRLLRFMNSLGHWREWAMPMELLAGDGAILRAELLAMGAGIAPTNSARNLLATYLQEKTPKRRVHCALQVGWCGDSFVLPDAVIGSRAAGVIFQSGERGHDEFTRDGTLAGWQEGIAARAVGNPLLVLALSAAFAGPLLARCNAEGGGVHYVGDSSTGKTTAIEAACSVWGGTNYRRSWRATANGMEGAAALFNDGLLALDEISEADPREVGAIVYALGNGRGKQRAGRTGTARAVVRWRCFVLSSGERTIGTTMQEGGHRAKAGQSVRMLDIPAARAFGAWDTLHGLPSGTAFSDAIKRAATIHHGHAGRAFLEKLTRDGQDFCALLEQIKALPEFAAEGSEGQERRAAGRFALLALAGEVATGYGLTGWPAGEAIQAAGEGFKAWRSLRGGEAGNDERRQIIDRVSAFIERHGDSRFSDMDKADESHIQNRAGWWRDTAEGREYLFNGDGLREALKGFDFMRGCDALIEVGALPKRDAGGKPSRFVRVRGSGMRLYPINANKLGQDHGA
jgi:putative DNA primase/helicase